MAADTTRRSSRAKRLNYAEIDSGTMGYGEDTQRFVKLLASKTFSPPQVKTVSGHELSRSWLVKHGFQFPVHVRNPNGLGMTIPPPEFGIRDVVRLVGATRPVDVIEVANQGEVKGWTLGDWGSYFIKKSSRTRVLNVISLEFSNTPLAEHVRSPQVVRDLDWIDQVWPQTRRKAIQYPVVQYYCLMSVEGSWTDFHIDFGGTSVWYHVHTGAKRFFFIPPTAANLAKYTDWTTSPDQSSRFFADEVDCCFQVDLVAGDTLMIPTGWIHAVLTPKDSLVFGGNFLHGLAIKGQLKIFELEQYTRVPRKFQFPMYEHLQWYAAAYYLKFVRNPKFLGAIKTAAKNPEVLEEIGLCRAELLGVPFLLQLLLKLLKRNKSLATSTGVKLKLKTGFDSEDAAAEAAASVFCASSTQLLEEFAGRLSGSWTAPVPTSPPAVPAEAEAEEEAGEEAAAAEPSPKRPRIRLRSSSTAGAKETHTPTQAAPAPAKVEEEAEDSAVKAEPTSTSQGEAASGAGAGEGEAGPAEVAQAEEPTASPPPRVKLVLKRKADQITKSKPVTQYYDLSDEEDDEPAPAAAKESDDEWEMEDGEDDYNPEDDYIDDEEEFRPKKVQRTSRVQLPKPKRAPRRSRPSGARRAPRPRAKLAQPTQHPFMKLKENLRNMARRRR